VSNPRVAFVARPPRGRMLVSDHWQRLEFRDTPGAWALVLTTGPLAEQLRWLAIGTFQQFATAGVIGRLVLPPIPLKLRVHWDALLRRYLDRQADLEGQWRLLRRRADKMLRTVLAGYEIFLDDPNDQAEVS